MVIKRFSKLHQSRVKNVSFISREDLVVNAILADTAEKLTKGLSGIDFLNLNEGMLFDFGEDRDVAMWMKGCLIDLDAAFISKDGNIVQVSTMLAQEPNVRHTCNQKIRYVLEVNSGFFDRYRIRVGDKVKIT